MRNDDGYTLKTWIESCDMWCGRFAGVDLDSCGDTNIYEAWSNNVAPRRHAIDSLRDAGCPIDDQGQPYRPKTLPKYYEESITLENGDVLVLERSHAANGHARIVRVESRNR